MAMRPPGCWPLNNLICSTSSSQSSPVWTTRNIGLCSWSLLGSKSLAHDTEARIRKFAASRILASPFMSKILFPTSIIGKDCRWRMGPSQHAHILILDRPIELRRSHFVIFRSLGVDWLLQSVGLSAFIGKWLVVKFRKFRAYFFREAFTKFYDIRSLSPISLYTFGYRRVPGGLLCGGI